MRFPVVSAVLIGLGFVAPSAAGEPTKRECAAAATRGQTLRDDKQLRASREALVACSAASCPTPIRKACTEWLAEVDARLPKITVHVVDAGDHEIADARVRIDEIDSRTATESVDPGPHSVQVRFNDRTLTESVTVSERENRSVVIRLPPSTAASTVAALPPSAPREKKAEPTTTSLPVSVWILGSVGALGVASFAFFGLRARAELDALDDPRTGCSPACAPDRADAARANAMVADVSLGVGIVALAVAAVVAISSRD
jgi:hypothetical protein